MSVSRLRHGPIHDDPVTTVPTRRFARANLPRIDGVLRFHPVTPGGNLRAATTREIIENTLARYGWDTRALRMEIVDFDPVVPEEIKDAAVDLRCLQTPSDRR